MQILCTACKYQGILEHISIDRLASSFSIFAYVSRRAIEQQYSQLVDL